MKKLIVLALTAALLTSCAHAFSEKVRKQENKGIPFLTAQMTIEQNIGYTFIWGGTIAGITVNEKGTYIEVVQTPLNKNGKVINIEVSAGRFVIFDPGQLDASVYHPGSVLSVAGILIGSINSTLDGKPYTYPLLENLQMILWSIKASTPEPKLPASAFK